MELHHVGVATREAEALAELYGDVLGAEVAHRERYDGLELWYLDVGGDYVELLDPVDGGEIASYLDRRGSGVHHVAFATPTIESALDRARSAGVSLVDEEPRDGGWGHRVAFLHPNSMGGVLVEFVEVEGT